MVDMRSPTLLHGSVYTDCICDPAAPFRPATLEEQTEVCSSSSGSCAGSTEFRCDGNRHQLAAGLGATVGWTSWLAEAEGVATTAQFANLTPPALHGSRSCCTSAHTASNRRTSRNHLGGHMFSKCTALHMLLLLSLLALSPVALADTDMTFETGIRMVARARANTSRHSGIHCKSLEAFADVLTLSGLVSKSPANSVERRSIILTSCDLNCMKELFKTWMTGLERARGGDHSMHVVIIATSLSALAHCEALRTAHRHRCVLDSMCGLPHGHMGFGSLSYTVSLLHKLEWVLEALRLNTTVMWLDMDIFVFDSPLPHLLTLDTDFAITSEDVGEKPFSGIAARWDATRDRPLAPNGGVWIVHPTLGGRQIMEYWVAVYTKRMFHDGRGGLDQEMLAMAINPGGEYYDNVTVWQNSADGPDVLLSVLPRPQGVKIHRLSPWKFQTYCNGPCGVVPAVQQIPGRLLDDGSMECTASPEWMSTYITFHANCCATKSQVLAGIAKMKMVGDASKWLVVPQMQPPTEV